MHLSMHKSGMISGEKLAMELGLSPTALSQIIHGKGRFAVSTRARVLARVREVGYTPHAGAAAARCQRFDTVAVFSTSTGASWKLAPLLIEGLMIGARAAGQRLLMEGVAEADLPALTARASLFGQRLCDGLVINHQMPPTDELRALAGACNVPVAWLNIRGEPGGIHPDDRGAGRRVVEALVGRGRRRLAWIDTAHDHTWASAIGGSHYSVRDRLDGARAAAEEAGVSLRVVSLPFKQATWESGQAAVAAAVCGSDPADGVIVCGATDVQLVLDACARRGWTPGKELSVIQFREWAHHNGQPIATALVPQAAVGSAAVAAVVAAVRSGCSVEEITIPFTYDWGSSL
jgi:DNA-binding LacI/PurR family transcriptional regulator